MLKDEMLKKGLCKLLHSLSVDSETQTPDFVLAEYLTACLQAHATAMKAHSWFKAQAYGASTAKFVSAMQNLKETRDSVAEIFNDNKHTNPSTLALFNGVTDLLHAFENRLR